MRLHALLLTPLLLLACGDDGGVGGTGAGGSGGSGGSGAGGSGAGPAGGGGAGASAAGGGGAGASGGGGAGGEGGNALDLSECDSNADCPNGTCVNLNGSYRVCQFPPVPATDCSGSKLDTCCSADDCPREQDCFATPITPFCGGIKLEPHNECAGDQCQADADCGDASICAPAGTVGNKVKMCLAAACTGICGQESLSPCALMRDPCCGNPVGFYCAFECHTDEECPDGYCNLGTCETGVPACPA